MGFPLSTFQQLAGLCKNEPYISKSFDEFKLISIIVHDTDDDGFRQQIRLNFEHLHDVTSKGFAFICFIKPPIKWSIGHIRWMSLRHSLTIGDGLDDAGFISALRRRLRIPSGPCIILTDNLLSNRYIILPTSKEDVVKQMEDISDYANAQPGRIPIDSKEFLSFLKTFKCAFTAKTEDNESVAKNIADLTAIRALTGAGAVKDKLAVNLQKTKARSYVKDELQSLWNKLESLRNNCKPEDADEIDSVLQILSDTLALIIETAEASKGQDYADDVPALTKAYDRYLIPVIETDILEPLTKSYLSNFNRLLPIYFGDDQSELCQSIDLNYLAPEGFKVDFSPLGNYLGKAIEEEMNASMVQKARQLMGVHMPSYWRRFERELNNKCEISTKKNKIYLNWKGKQLSSFDYTDQSFPIGVVVSLLKELSHDSEKGPQMGWCCDKEYIDRADKFAHLRNNACHTGIFGQSEFEVMYDAFNRITSIDLPEMIRLKKSILGVSFCQQFN